MREATHSDIPAMADMGRKFALKAAPHVGFNRDSVERLLTSLIDSDDGLVLVGDSSMFGAIIYPHPFNSAHRVAQELFWWSEGREGLALFGEAEKRLHGRCDSFVMITLETVNPDRMANIYQKRGFVPMERGFVKDMTWQ